MPIEVEKSTTRDFIECYRQHQFLWDVDHIDYNNKRKRKEGYAGLQKILQRIKPHATIKDTARKVHTLRSNYTREKKRQLRLKKLKDDSRDTEDDKPTLFYFDDMAFLDPILNTPKRKNTTDLNLLFPDQSQISEIHEDNASELEFEFASKSDFVDVTIPSPLDKTEFNQSESSKHEIKSSIKEIKRQSLKNYDDDEAEIFGRSWSIQFRNLSEDQKIYAKKAFEDILFEAKLGTLHRHSIKINDSLCQNCLTLLTPDI